MDYNEIQITERRAMTVLPDDIEDSTGKRIEGTATVKDTQLGNWQGQNPTDYEDVEQDALSDEDQDPSIKIRLAETFEDATQTDFEVDPLHAYEIASADIGNSRSDAAVQLFASRVYNGELTPEEAVQSAIATGIDPDALMASYYKLKEHFTND